jgi:hypothetical protein
LFTSFESDTESSYLPDEIIIPPSEDGSYTPPSPDSALLSAVKHASSQDIRKYSQLINQVNGFTDEWDYNQESGCGKWQEKYTQLHEKNLEILKNYQDGVFQPEITKENRPRYISYVCTAIEKDKNRGCGGLGDRMNGRYLYKKQRGKRYS